MLAGAAKRGSPIRYCALRSTRWLPGLSMPTWVVGSDLGDRWFFLFGFEKNDRDNIDARLLLEMKPRQLDQAVEAGELMEIE